MMAVALIFCLGIANFALHKAVMDSRHPMTEQIPWLANPNGRKVALAIEFGVLFAAMLLAANGWPAPVWGYFVYSSLNGLSAWLILSGKV
ncbi:hypothetical protein [Pontixanthobacter sp.]|uniref:hypothetical protein n=1 Tax=Pontixanthobacter sp. TaxID=2792078 RepID=UPI003C7E44FE